MRVGWSASRCCSTSSSRRCSEGSLRGGSAQGFREPLGCGDHCRRVHPAGLAGETLERARDRDGGDDLPAGGADRRGDGGHALLALADGLGPASATDAGESSRGVCRVLQAPRSEERRVGKEGVSTCRFRGSPYHYKKKIYVKTSTTTNLIYNNLISVIA